MVSTTLPIEKLSLKDIKKETAAFDAIINGLNNKAKVAETLAQLNKQLSTKTLPSTAQFIPALLDLVSDKEKQVRDDSEALLRKVFGLIHGMSLKTILPVLFEAMSLGKKWQTKHMALDLLKSFTDKYPQQVAALLPAIVPEVSALMWDTKPQVKEIATATMTSVTSVIGNLDLEPFLPVVIECIARPENVPECVHKLASTTFVKTVDAPCLAIMTPLLERSLTERSPAVLRQAAIIIGNMCKLVENPADAVQFLPLLLPGIDRIIEIAANPELRSVADKTRAVLLRVAGGDVLDLRGVTIPHDELKAILIKHASSVSDVTADYILAIVSQLIWFGNFEEKDWISIAFAPFLDVKKEVVKAFLAETKDLDAKRKHEAYKAQHPDDDEEGEDLCDCEFSLAYGGMILLNNTRMRLKRGHRYGLCGHNGCGKSTLMRAIANGQVEGFPAPDVLKTVYVEHNLQASEAELSVVEFICSDEDVSKRHTRDEIVKGLADVGFDDDLRAKHVGGLSGGWKMKLELARAMLLNADILLLDEPTNHLDTTNVAWLEAYLTSLTDVTCLIVSHDSKFLDNVCTNIIHYEDRKLKTYKGNLSEFVKKKPEAKAYYELSNEQFAFKFPEPGFLDGVKSKDKAILKMSNVEFTYPGSAKVTVTGVTIQCALSSRIAVIGKNGAGKSTIIKLLTGELVPSSGEVWKHPNLRVAYVAQHAFHHLEEHLDKTPNQYIQWRYQYGEDKESLTKESKKMTAEDDAQMKKVFNIEGEKRVVEEFVGRKKMKRDFEYEVKWLNVPHDLNTWHSRDELVRWGFEKFLIAYDDKEAARQGLYARPLTAANVEKHLADVGLEAEFATHSRIRGLSGGQKVKVVLGAAMWNNTHILVLDEPTNYLDRDSLGALAGAIKEFGGGVLMISHNNEFTGALCPEKWFVEDGILSIDGVSTTIKEKIELKEKTEAIDAFGNTIKLKSQRKLTRKEQKQREKRRKDAAKRGEVLSDDDEFED